MRIVSALTCILAAVVLSQGLVLWAQDQPGRAREGRKTGIDKMDRAPETAEARAFAAYEKGDYAEALRQALKAEKAGRGDSGLSSVLSDIYREGLGVEKNKAEALKWCRVTVRRLRSESGEGDVVSTANLGYYYLTGSCLKKDYAEAFRLSDEAAKQGASAGMNNLGDCYEKGHGVARDYVEAMKWYLLAAAMGLEIAQEGIRDVKPHLTTEQSAEAKRRADYLARYNHWPQP